MKNFEVKDTRNFAIISHGHAGKTTLADALLFNAGVTSRIGSVEQGTTICDFDDDEKRRQISISAKLINYEWKGKVNFGIVTPGYTDFFGDVISSLHAVDGAVIVVCGANGVEVGTQKVWKQANKRNLPRMIFINKLDKEHANYISTVDSIRSIFGVNCVPITLPVGLNASLSDVANLFTGTNIDKLSGDIAGKVNEYKVMIEEAAAESDDSLTEKYLNEGSLTPEELVQGLRKGLCHNTIVPIFCGSAEKNIGVKELMDGISEDMPSPEDRGEIVTTEEDKTIKPDKKAPFSAFVFKHVVDPHAGNLTYLRIYSGTVVPNTEVANVTKGSKEKIGNILTLNGKDTKQVDSASAGDIIVVAKMKSTSYNNTLTDSSNKVELPNIEFGKPLVSLAVRPKAKGDEEKIGTGLHKITEEDPTLILARHPETKELVISGMGDLHIEIAFDRLRKRYGVEIETSVPKVAYKETIKKNAEGHCKYKKQSGGKGQYGEVYIKIEPLEKGKAFEFVDAIVGGSIPKNYIPAVEKGIIGAMGEGVLSGNKMVDVKVTLYDGSFHTVDSSEMAFKIAGSKAFKEACEKANLILLEPIMTVDVYVPGKFMGDISGLLNSKRGRIMGMDDIGDIKKITAQVPIAEIHKFATELRSLTGGQGTYEMDFSHYEEVPAQIAQKVIELSKKEEEAHAHAHAHAKE
ncbi:MAG: elongation factor G [Candidatus Ancaeobacter aquaticus]|nr:elongation factor G [Candidatus Ancaeobacter aquaticus]